jgi:glycosyltransferase involved in cell wall biosynthesis
MRQIVFVDPRPGLDKRLDVLVHAAAQLPDDVMVTIPAPDGSGGRLSDIAQAYGIETRVQLRAAPDIPADAITVQPGAASGRDRGPWLDWQVSFPSGEKRRAGTMAELLDAVTEPNDPPASSRGPDREFAGRRVALVTNIPIHYRIPVLNRVATRVTAAGGEFRVLFAGGGRREHRPWIRHQRIEFDHRFLAVRRNPGPDIPVGLGRALRDFDPTVVVSAGFSPFVTGRAVHFAHQSGIPFGLWSGDVFWRQTARSRLRRRQRRWILDRTSFAVSYGWLAAEYLRQVAPELPVVIGRNTSPFPPQRGERDESREELRVLAVGRAAPGKGLDTAIDAFLELGDLPCRLTIAGGGSELESLRVRARHSRRISLLGAVDSDRILECYRDADIFLFPSHIDVFGMVLAEAMGAGLATITSSTPGGVADLAVHEQNSIVLDSHEPHAWAESIRRLVENPGLRRELGRKAQATIARRWTVEHSADAWVSAFRLGLIQAGLA